MKLTKETKAKIREKIEKAAAAAYLSNIYEDDFPENFMDILKRNHFCETEDKGIDPWWPLENCEPGYLENIISAHADAIEESFLAILSELYPNDNIAIQWNNLH